MRIKGKRLSQQARAKLNAVLLEWLNENKDRIDDCCLIAELFGKTRWRGAPLERLRDGMGSLLNNLRVLCRDYPGACTVASLEEVQGYCAREKSSWERLSTTLKGAFVGLDHSTVIKSEQAARERAKESKS